MKNAWRLLIMERVIHTLRHQIKRHNPNTKNKEKNWTAQRFPSSRFVLLCLWFSLCLTVEAAQAPRALPAQTLAKIRAALEAPEMQAGHVGLLVSALGTAETPQSFPAVLFDDKTQPILFEQNADKRFLPASNMKLFTSAMALKVLGADKTFPTTVFHSPPTRGTPAGQLWLHGGGDMSLGAKDLDDLSEKIKNSGVRKYASLGASGTLYHAEGFANRFPDGWTLDDTLWYYGPVVNALAYERNHIDVTITGGAKTGDVATVFTPEGAPRFVRGDNLKTGTAELASREDDDLLTVQSLGAPRADGTTTIISGTLAPNQKVNLGVAVPDVNDWVTSAFATSLQRNGVPQAEKVLRLKAKPDPLTFGEPREIARHESPPVRELLKRLLKNSDNLYAEMMLRNAAVYSLPEDKRSPDLNYARRGHQLILDWLKENNVSTTGLNFTDGSGLSRYNLVTPRVVAGLLSAVEKVPDAGVFWDALPIAGVDGTMRNRCKNTPAENNARAKSGTFSIVSCLSGYVTTKDKQRLSVVILTNFVSAGAAARKMQDEIFAALAEADISSADISANNGTRP